MYIVVRVCLLREQKQNSTRIGSSRKSIANTTEASTSLTRNTTRKIAASAALYIRNCSRRDKSNTVRGESQVLCNRFIAEKSNSTAAELSFEYVGFVWGSRKLPHATMQQRDESAAGSRVEEGSRSSMAARQPQQEKSSSCYCSLHETLL